MIKNDQVFQKMTKIGSGTLQSSADKQIIGRIGRAASPLSMG